MNKDVVTSRRAVSRRRALSIGGSVGVGALLAGCGDSETGSTTSNAETATSTSALSGTGTNAATSHDVVTLLGQAGTCTLAQEETQGPYWFDVDSIRSDLREDRPGATLDLAVRVQDISACSSGGDVAPVSNCVVEIWHCDAGGVYSGFESGSMSAGGGVPQGGDMPSGGMPSGEMPSGEMPSGEMPSGEMPSGEMPSGEMPSGGMPSGEMPPDFGGGMDGGSGQTSDGSYSEGDDEATVSDDGTYLRGAQVANSKGIAEFTTIYPGWYSGRTVHIHLKVHVDKATVLTTQPFFDEALNDEVFATAPYDEHTGRDTTNDSDSIFDPVGLLTTAKTDDGYLAVINLGVDV